MKKMLIKRIHGKNGFTLAETLLAVIILLLAATIVATGIPAARNAYEKVVLASNAEILLSTTMSTLRNELGMARDIRIDPDKQTISFYSEERKAPSKIYINSGGDYNGNAVILIQRYALGEGAEDPDWLVSEVASTDGLYVTYESAQRHSNEKGDYITFENLRVNRRGGGAGLAAREAFSVRIVSE